MTTHEENNSIKPPSTSTFITPNEVREYNGSDSDYETDSVFSAESEVNEVLPTSGNHFVYPTPGKTYDSPSEFSDFLFASECRYLFHFQY